MINNIFDNLPDRILTDETFETLLQHEHLKIERIISTGQTTPENQWYTQAYDEWVILLQGHARLLFENEIEIMLKPGDYLFIEAYKRHRVTWTNPDEVCIWLALHIAIP